MMFEFSVIAAAMIVAAILVVAIPLWRGGKKSGPDEDAVSVKLYRQRVAELEQDVASGVVPAEDMEQARAELDRQLLDDTEGVERRQAQAGRRGKWTAGAVVLLIPLFGLGVYNEVGGMPWRSHSQPEPNANAAKVQDMVNGLAQRLQNNPDDGQGWKMLGRSYMVMGRYSDAVKALVHAREVLGDSPETLTDYAEALAMSGGSRSLVGKPDKALKKALSMDPTYPKALWLAGIAAQEQGDTPTAIKYWQRLLDEHKVTGKSEDMLKRTIAQARKQMGDMAAAAAGAPEKVSTSVTSGKKARIEVRVALSPGVAKMARPDDPVFIFARPLDGSKMPVAVARRQVKDLPASVVLADNGGMVPGKSLDHYSKVQVAARVSIHGTATPETGDLETKSETVSVSGSDPVKLVIDHVLKAGAQ